MTGRVPEGERRKSFPLATGLIDFFPDACLAVAELSQVSNDQHLGPGRPLEWKRDSAPNHADALLRHFMDRGEHTSDGVRHTAAVAWRALAMLQQEIDDERLMATLRSAEPGEEQEEIDQSQAAKIIGHDDGAPIPAFLARTERDIS